MSEAMAITNETVRPTATNRMMRALISSLVILCLGTASSSDLVCGLYCEGFVALPFAVHFWTVSATTQAEGRCQTEAD